MDLDLYRYRNAIIQESRSFFQKKDFLEVETPILSPLCIPESSIPLFRTVRKHPWNDDQLLQLLPSPEYYMKQLLAKGWPSMFQFSKSFRNGENLGRIHASEFTMLEYYALGADYLDSIKLTEEFFHHVNNAIELPCPVPAGPFPRISMQEAFKAHAGIDLSELCGEDGHAADSDDLKRARKLCSAAGIEWHEHDDWEMLFNRIFLNKVEEELDSAEMPLVLIDYPAKLQSLSCPKASSPWTQRWELYWKGVELANCFTEETDSRRMRDFFEREIQSMQSHQDPDMQTIADPDFPNKISDMPECSGTALGMDRFIMLLLGKSSLTEILPFS